MESHDREDQTLVVLKLKVHFSAHRGTDAPLLTPHPGLQAPEKDEVRLVTSTSTPSAFPAFLDSTSPLTLCLFPKKELGMLSLSPLHVL